MFDKSKNFLWFFILFFTFLAFALACGDTGGGGNKAPSVTLTPNSFSGKAPLTVNFTANASDPDGSIAKYEWDLDGNGTFESNTAINTAQYTYTIASTYNARVQVTDNNGATAIATVIINVLTQNNTDVSAQITDARNLLGNQDITGANAKFKEAYDLNPANLDANFGLAITDIILLADNDKVKNIIDKLGSQADTTLFMVYNSYKVPNVKKLARINMKENTKNFRANAKALFEKLPKNKISIYKQAKSIMARTIPQNAPSFSEIQDIIENTILPVIESSITKLNLIENKNYTFTVTPSMTDNTASNAIVLDDGEFFALDALLNGIKGFLYIPIAYNVDVDYNLIEADPLSCLNGSIWGLQSNIDHAKFLTLKTDGQTKMTTAGDAFKEVIAKIEAAYHYVKNNDSDINTDNGINLNGLTSEEHETIQKWIDVSKMISQGLVTYQETIANGIRTSTLTNGTDTIQLDQKGTTDTDTFSIRVDITKFFSNPLDRTNLPTLVYDLPPDQTLSNQYNEPINKFVGPYEDDVIRCEIQNTSSIPEKTKTLNGVLPDGIPDFDGLLIFNKAIALDKDAWSDSNWNALAADGTNFYIAQTSGYYSTNIIEINSETGAILNTHTIQNLSEIRGLTFAGNDLWALKNDGISKIDLTSNIITTTISVANNYNFFYGLRGLTYANQNFYLGLEIWYQSNEDDLRGIVKFPSNSTSIPTTFWNNTNNLSKWTIDELAHDGNYLWVSGSGNTLKIDANSATVKSYINQNIGLCLNGKLYSRRYDRILVFTEP
ncbi:PKD domain-containing protein [Candidatus Desantisbacteria bacterium]|nr:PKD domain-containing protein [Candidatus Desantisbacteria bacterium]